MATSELTPAHLLTRIRERCEQDFTFYARYFFKVRKGSKFTFNDHHHRLCDELMAVYRGEVQNLIVNMPPRFSKCCPRDTLVATRRGQERIQMIKPGDVVLSHIDGRIVEQKVLATEVFRKECVEIKTKSGRVLRASHDHPVLTQRGWVKSEDLTDNHYLIRVCAEIDGKSRIDSAELDFVTLMLFEGGCSGRNIRFTTADKSVIDIFQGAADSLGFEVKQYACNSHIDYNVMGGMGGVACSLLRKHGMLGCLARNKRMPSAFFDLPLDQKYRFLSLMFATDGYVVKRSGMLGVSLASEGLIDDIGLLLDSCGIPSRKYAKPNAHAGAWELLIGASHIQRLRGKIDLLHKQPDFIAALDRKFRPSTIFGYPYDVAKGLILKCHNAHPKIDFKRSGVMVSDDKFARMRDEIDPSLSRWEMDDFIYDRVDCVARYGIDEVFHLEIDADDYDHKNYIANGFVVHNTELCVILFASWCYMKNPRSEFIHLSYSNPLALENSNSIREIIKSAEFRQLWPHITIKDNKDAKGAWGTAQGGQFLATAAGGSVTGFGAGRLDECESGEFVFSGCLLIDDPLKPDDARHDVMREAVNRRWDETIKSRRNSPRTPTIVIMQRIDERDFTATLLADTELQWRHVCMPALVDEGMETERSLWPAKFSVEQLRAMRDKKNDRGETNPIARAVFNSQYQQRPASVEGNMLKASWWRYYASREEVENRCTFFFFTADTAYTKNSANDPSSLMLWGAERGKRLYLLDRISGHWEFPQLMEQAKKFWGTKPEAQRLYVEAKASGLSLIQSLRKQGVKAHAWKPKDYGYPDDKVGRVKEASWLIFSGDIWLPDAEEAPWVESVVDQCSAFTVDDSHAHDDDVDCITMATSIWAHYGGGTQRGQEQATG